MSLSLQQIIDFQTNGYVIADNVLTDADLQPVIDELSQTIDNRARALQAEGKLTDLYENEPFERRFAKLGEQCPEIKKGFDIMLLRGPRMYELLHNERLLDVVECLLGSEIECNPIQHLRAKLPWALDEERPRGLEGNVPWHQDVAVTTEDSDASEIITFWLPLVDATAATGCMEVIPGAFKSGYLRHVAEGGTTIDPQVLPHSAPATAECRKGGVVIMSKYTPHRGLDNHSDIIRWSIDLRYHKTGVPSGRSFQPSFVVRSRRDPSSAVPNYAEWCRRWEEALAAKRPMTLHRV
jgi:hypothetical protein